MRLRDPTAITLAMKYLFLLRHAKSSWADGGLSDRDRSLNQRGLQDAPIMGQRLVQGEWQPTLIVSSPAVRALTTAEYMAEALGVGPDDIVLDERIYEASTARLMTVIREFDDGCDRIMLVGHNPGLTDLLNEIDTVRIDNVPTCGIATLAFDVDAWANVDITQANLLAFDYPKNNPAGEKK